MIILASGFLDDGIGFQVGQVPQLGLADAVVTQAFHYAADFRRGIQGAMGNPQRAGSGRRGPTGDDLASCLPSAHSPLLMSPDRTP